MGKITYALYLRTRRKANGLNDLVVRRTENRKHKYVEVITQLRYCKKKGDSEWDKHNRQVINRPDAEALNDICWNRLKHHRGKGTVGDGDSDLFRFAYQRISVLDGLGKVSKRKRINTVIQHIKKHSGKLTGPRFSDVDHAWVEKFKVYLINNIVCREEKPSDNTVSNYLDTLSQLFNEAIEASEYAGSNPFHQDPVRKLIPTRIPGSPKKLAKDELSKLLSVQVNTVGFTKRMFDATMLFFFQFASNGMRIGDALGLKWSNITPEGIKLLNEKTNKYQTVEFNAKNVSCLRWFIDYENNHKVWDWDQRKFSWEKETFTDHRLESALLSLDGEYFDALAEVSRWREQAIFDYPGYYLSQKSEYDLEMEVLQRIPPSVKQRVECLEEQRNREILRIIFRDISNTHKANQYIFPYMRKYASTRDRKVLRERKDSCATMVNKQLKKVARLLQIREFSTHWNRHSLAQKLAEENVDIHIIKEMFNHSSYRVTENYMNSFKANTKGIYDKVFKGISV